MAQLRDAFRRPNKQKRAVISADGQFVINELEASPGRKIRKLFREPELSKKAEALLSKNHNQRRRISDRFAGDLHTMHNAFQLRD
jgi:hypothetical protein